MDILWDCPEQLRTRDVLQRVTSHTLAYTTVATVLTNLVKKGMVERISAGRIWAHRPLQTRSQYAAGLMAEALTISEDPAASFLHFVETMSEEDATLLRELLVNPAHESGLGRSGPTVPRAT
jgi:predicted transcriptional regulator